MDFLGWSSNYVARCAVSVFEAAGGSLGWHDSGTIGELHMRPLGDGMINFQLHDLLDGQKLFEYTMRKPQSFTSPVDRFFVISLENGSFRGFGFAYSSAAIEMKDRVIKAVQPYSIGTTPIPIVDELPTESSGKNSVVSYRSVPRRSTSSRPFNNAERTTPQTRDTLHSQLLESSSFSGKPKKRRSWKVGKAVTALSHLFVWRNNELDIGYPTDVKHVAHIGWDVPSINGPGWMDELRPGPDYSSGPLSEFGQPLGPEWYHDAASASKWISSFGKISADPLPHAFMVCWISWQCDALTTHDLVPTLVFFLIDDVYISSDKGGGTDVDNPAVLPLGKTNERHAKAHQQLSFGMCRKQIRNTSSSS